MRVKALLEFWKTVLRATAIVLLALFLAIPAMDAVAIVGARVFPTAWAQGLPFVIGPVGANPMMIRLPGGLTWEYGLSASVANASTLAISYSFYLGVPACANSSLAIGIQPAAALSAVANVITVTATGFTINNPGTVASTFYWWAMCF